MTLEHPLLKAFEPVITETYNIALASEKATKNIVFPSKESYIGACLNDFNKAQNIIAAEVIEAYEMQKEREQAIKNHRRESIVNKEVIAELNLQIKVLENRNTCSSAAL